MSRRKSAVKSARDDGTAPPTPQAGERRGADASVRHGGKFADRSRGGKGGAASEGKTRHSLHFQEAKVFPTPGSQPEEQDRPPDCFHLGSTASVVES